ncbi:MAG: hypothetical protein ABT01_04540 [Clostridium sp. SCN 57-10]|nr:MAG: hypothetical protein ABT01_04540 [Clostridium sp. SCN 57-10]
MQAERLKHNERVQIADSLLFSGATQASLDACLRSDGCELCVYQKGDTIFHTNHFRHSLGYLLSGRIGVSRPDEQRRTSLSTIDKGHFFGAAAVFSPDAEYVTLLVAQKPCRVLFFEQQLLESLMREDFAVTKNYIAFLTGRIRFLNEKIQALTAGSPEQTLALYLTSRMAETDGVFSVELNGSLSQLAEQLNIGRASLYRAFDMLCTEQVIARDKKLIMILRPDALSDITTTRREPQ